MSFTNKDGLQISYDYEDLIMDLEQDVKDGNFKMSDIIVVERSAKDRMGYKPILDYFADEDTADLAMMDGYAKPENDYIYMTVHHILDEMKEINETI